jgi:plasmid maintenance system antidote protein VapI
MNPQFWLNLQSTYDLARARRDSGAEVAALPQRVAA